MVAQRARRLPAGGGDVAAYDFEYELESTRGRKRILSTGAPGGAALPAWGRQRPPLLGGCSAEGGLRGGVAPAPPPHAALLAWHVARDAAVTIAGRKLFIVNGNISCGKESCGGVEARLPLLRATTQSLALL